MFKVGERVAVIHLFSPSSSASLSNPNDVGKFVPYVIARDFPATECWNTDADHHKCMVSVICPTGVGARNLQGWLGSVQLPTPNNKRGF